jgi:hypothetical protein
LSRVAGRTVFALIEWLKVRAIIGILAAILFPVVGAVFQCIRRIQCITNLRPIHLVITILAEAYSGEYLRARLLNVPGHGPACLEALPSVMEETNQWP